MQREPALPGSMVQQRLSGLHPVLIRLHGTGAGCEHTGESMKGHPPDSRYINGEEFELLPGNPDTGFLSKGRAQQLAKDWLGYPKGGHARVIPWKGRYWVYGN